MSIDPNPTVVIGQWTTVDKTEWPDGPWQHEPDKVHWIDEATDMDCLIVRGPSGALCGYVAVPPGHPAYETPYQDVRVLDEDGDEDWPDVHGGLSFSEFCAETGDESRYVCHRPSPGRPDRVWWFGFDCCHSLDLRPGRKIYREDDETYRTLAYVRGQVRKLAAQLVGAYVPEASE